MSARPFYKNYPLETMWKFKRARRNQQSLNDFLSKLLEGQELLIERQAILSNSVSELSSEVARQREWILAINHRALMLDELGLYLPTLSSLNNRLTQLYSEAEKSAESSFINAEACALLVSALERSLQQLDRSR